MVGYHLPLKYSPRRDCKRAPCVELVRLDDTAFRPGIKNAIFDLPGGYQGFGRNDHIAKPRVTRILPI